MPRSTSWPPAQKKGLGQLLTTVNGSGHKAFYLQSKGDSTEHNTEGANVMDLWVTVTEELAVGEKKFMLPNTLEQLQNCEPGGKFGRTCQVPYCVKL